MTPHLRNLKGIILRFILFTALPLTFNIAGAEKRVLCICGTSCDAIEGSSSSVPAAIFDNIGESTQYVISPNYPKIYPNNRECICSVSAQAGSNIQLSAEAFQLEPRSDVDSSCSDYFMTQAWTSAHYCYQELTETRLNKNEGMLHFKSNSIRQFQGFLIKVQALSSGSPMPLEITCWSEAGDDVSSTIEPTELVSDDSMVTVTATTTTTTVATFATTMVDPLATAAVGPSSIRIIIVVAGIAIFICIVVIVIGFVCKKFRDDTENMLSGPTSHGNLEGVQNSNLGGQTSLSNWSSNASQNNSVRNQGSPGNTINRYGGEGDSTDAPSGQSYVDFEPLPIS